MYYLRYSATRGLLFSHVGWIFFKPKYPKLHLIEREDLEEDPGESTRRDPASRVKSADRVPCLVVRLQHRYFGESVVQTHVGVLTSDV
jgi:hypothetical protein